MDIKKVLEVHVQNNSFAVQFFAFIHICILYETIEYKIKDNLSMFFKSKNASQKMILNFSPNIE